MAQLDLSLEEVLKYSFTEKGINNIRNLGRRFKRHERMKIVHAYVAYILKLYSDTFNGSHVPIDIIKGAADQLCNMMPIQLADPEYSTENPRYVRKSVMTLNLGQSNRSIDLLWSYINLVLSLHCLLLMSLKFCL